MNTIMGNTDGFTGGLKEFFKSMRGGSKKYVHVGKDRGINSDLYFYDGDKIVASLKYENAKKGIHFGKTSSSIVSSDGGLVSLGYWERREHAVFSLCYAYDNNKTYDEYIKEGTNE